MYNVVECSTNQMGTAPASCVSDLSVIVKIFLAKTGFYFETEADAKSREKWDEAIQARNIIPLPEAFMVENSDEDAVTETGSTGAVYKVREGKAISTYNLITTLCTHRRLRSYDKFKGGYYAVDENGNVLGWSDDGIKFQPFTIDQLFVNKMLKSDGSTARKTPVYIVDKNASEFNDYGASFKVDWGIKDLEGLISVSLQIVSASATEIVVNALTSCEGDGVEGLDAATDWVVKDTDGNEQTVTTVTDNGNGNYTLAATAFVSGTAKLANPETPLSVSGYQGALSVGFTIA